jgi:hypothetical protein
MSVSVTFTAVGATVTKTSQGMAFALQSIQKRLPRIIGPAIEGLVLTAAARHQSGAEVGYVIGARPGIWFQVGSNVPRRIGRHATFVVVGPVAGTCSCVLVTIVACIEDWTFNQGSWVRVPHRSPVFIGVS